MRRGQALNIFLTIITIVVMVIVAIFPNQLSQIGDQIFGAPTHNSQNSDDSIYEENEPNLDFISDWRLTGIRVFRILATIFGIVCVLIYILELESSGLMFAAFISGLITFVSLILLISLKILRSSSMVWIILCAVVALSFFIYILKYLDQRFLDEGELIGRRSYQYGSSSLLD